MYEYKVERLTIKRYLGQTESKESQLCKIKTELISIKKTWTDFHRFYVNRLIVVWLFSP